MKVFVGVLKFIAGDDSEDFEVYVHVRSIVLPISHSSVRLCCHNVIPRGQSITLSSMLRPGLLPFLLCTSYEISAFKD